MKIWMENNTSFQLSEKMNQLIEEIIVQALKEENYPLNVEVSITFVDNNEIQAINKEYRNIDQPTDVLSFPLLEFEDSVIGDNDSFSLEDLEEYLNPETGDLMLGDIIISIDKAIEQAKEYNHSLEREIGFLVSHSMFHLMGYDHMEEDEEKVMFEKQEKVLQTVGLSRS
ncbi:rRNA maturation RNase YbeY [Defluviitalea saccharophila]|uniref:Endoribonuclease YbeY n=1 Tax=Defluviitalea saccharophila TaxID=879970 RepID=A0ABZ2Y481_9FIRM